MTDEDFMARFVAVASGDAEGCRWTIRVGGTPDDFYTILEVEQADGRLGGGGAAGPALWQDHMFNVATGTGDDGPIWIVGRAHPSVTRVLVEIDGQQGIELRPGGDATQYGLRFFATLLPHRTRLSRISAHDKDGQLVDEHTGPFFYSRPPDPSHGSRTNADGSAYWIPAQEG